MDGYYSTIFEENRGAILMAVCRGRISEGLDFSDKAARAVIVVGIPFAQLNDPKIVLKKDYLDRKSKKSLTDEMDGQAWYKQQALRAVN